ncbi:MAG TPA: HDOD domain-containing protein [Candidatus Krumholzibacteria bacterium]|nr:HDOD domain-containing protein [Candidatus Krumholzibacteria bacterium]
MEFVVGPVLADEISGIESMPAAVSRIASMLDDPDADATAFARVLELDARLTADVLRLANSAWSQPTQPILTVRDAVMRIGAAVVLKMAVGSRTAQSLSRPSDGYDLGEGELWRHSVAAALAAERMGAYTKVAVPGAAFTAALLHDIGKVPLTRRLGRDGLRELWTLIESTDLTPLEAERRLLGTDHAEAGESIAREWGLPDALATAIGAHHDPDAAPTTVGDAVHVGNLVAKFVGVGLGSDGMAINMSDAAAHRLGLSSDKLEALCADVATGLAGAIELFEGVSHGA